MKKLGYSVFLAPLVLVAMLASCAKSESTTDITAAQELEALRSWVAINYPDLVEYEEGLFMKVYSDNPLGDDEEVEYTDYDWIEATYTAQVLDTRYYYNMYSAISDTLGTFSFYTHFVPDRVLYSTSEYYMSEAQKYALSKMSSQDSVVIVATSDYVVDGNTGYYAPYGYQGTTILTDGSPALIKMKLNDVIDDISYHQITQVTDYVTTEMGMTASDSIVGISRMYMEMLVTNTEGDVIGRDSTVQIYYTGQFTDGFVFDTNDEDVAIENNLYNSDYSYDPISFIADPADGSDNGYITGFTEAILQLRKGEKARFIFTSNIGYGSTGSSPSIDDSSTTEGSVILPYEPLVFIIQVLDTDEEIEIETY
ncbi:MAG: FKBP-type peptidyl-prolyl cis-trans isomerase [Rikenellaceae bacterium]